VAFAAAAAAAASWRFSTSRMGSVELQLKYTTPEISWVAAESMIIGA
jgi:hypothetical protein